MASDEFKKTVDSGSVFQIRSALLDDLIIDRTFQQFDKDLAYAKDRVGTIMDPYDGEDFQQEKDWNMDYLNEQKAALMCNFSEKRIEHLKSVIRSVMPAKSSTSSTGETDQINSQAEVDREQKKATSSNTNTGRKAAKVDAEIILIACGVVSAVAGIATSEMILVGAGVAAAGVGCVLKIVRK